MPFDPKTPAEPGAEPEQYFQIRTSRYGLSVRCELCPQFIWDIPGSAPAETIVSFMADHFAKIHPSHAAESDDLVLAVIRHRDLVLAEVDRQFGDGLLGDADYAELRTRVVRAFSELHEAAVRRRSEADS